MKHREDTWGWILAIDFFFAGMGGAMLVIAGLIDLFVGPGSISMLGNFAAPVFVAMGASLLILELGRPFQSWRVFMNPKSIIGFGAWCMAVAIGCGFIYASFGLSSLPWASVVLLRQLVAIVGIVAGLIVATYPGVLLARHKARPFWTGPGMIVLFMLSSLVTGVAGHMLAGFILPAAFMDVLANMRWIAAGLLALELILWPGYVWVKRTGATTREAEAVQSWISGNYAAAFWGGLLGAGTLLPLGLMLLPGAVFQVIGALLVLFGGALMRWNVIYSGETRTWLPGEEKYRANLPLGDEAFLQAWK